MKYTFTVLGPGGGATAREKLILESRGGESAHHIALKIVAYLLFHAAAAPLRLMVERPVGQRHKPDLVAIEPETGSVRLWIDCGQIETERLGRIAARNPAATVLVVKATHQEARLYAEAARRWLPTNGRQAGATVGVLGFEEGFIAGIREALRGVNRVEVVSPLVPVTENDLEGNLKNLISPWLSSEEGEETFQIVMNQSVLTTVLRLFTP